MYLVWIRYSKVRKLVRCMFLIFLPHVLHFMLWHFIICHSNYWFLINSPGFHYYMTYTPMSIKPINSPFCCSSLTWSFICKIFVNCVHLLHPDLGSVSLVVFCFDHWSLACSLVFLSRWFRLLTFADQYDHVYRTVSLLPRGCVAFVILRIVTCFKIMAFQSLTL